MKQLDSLQFALPHWIAGYVEGHDYFPDVEARMRVVLGAAEMNISAQSGGPFAAAVFERDSGRLISLGVNLVTTQGLSMLHAEMVAIALAQRKLASFDLGAAGFVAHELVTSCEPCAMCFGAIPWSGVRRLICGARDVDAREIGFDEGPKLNDWEAALQQRGITVVGDVLRDEAQLLLRRYAQGGGAIYNSRDAN